VTRRTRTPVKPAEPPIFEIGHSFGFDATHRFTRLPRGHKYRGLHGHSFRVEVALRGPARPPHGFVTDMARLEAACKRIHGRLDHALLNQIAGLDNPSLENLCLWIWRALKPRFPSLSRVTMRRDSLGQSCTYLG
jgi:6-pyruvoyltetrahydropterin/6-carboxytetrahydropterin synthase